MTATTTVTAQTGSDVLESFYTDSTFWGSTEPLKALREFAITRMLNPMGVLMTAIMRAASTLPPDVLVQGDKGPSTLNMFVAACAPSGGSKGETFRAASQLIPALRETTAETAGVTSGEGMAAQYASMAYDVDENGKALKNNGMHVQLHTVYQLANAAEISGLAALASRSGSTSVDRLLRAWSGESLSSDNKSVENRLRIPGGAYRLALYVGVQPSAAGLLSDGSGVGLAQRFLYAPITPDPDSIPEHRPTFFPDAPALHLTERVGEPDIHDWEAVYEAGDWTRIHPRIIRIPDAICDAIWDYRRSQYASDDTNPLDAHRLLLTMRVAAILACMEADGLPPRMTVSDDQWQRALYIVAKSCETRDKLFSDYAKTCSEARAKRLTIEGIAREAANENVEDRAVLKAKRAIVRFMLTHSIVTGAELTPVQLNPSIKDADGLPQGLTGSRIRSGIARRWSERWGDAMQELISDGIITPFGDAPTAGRPLTEITWAVVWASIPSELMPKPRA